MTKPTRPMVLLAMCLVALPASATLTEDDPAGNALTITGRMDAAGCALSVEPAALAGDGRERTTHCLAAGKPAVIRDDASGVIYLATFPAAKPADRTRWLKQPGNRVRVTGKVTEREGARFLEVERLRVEHDHDAAPHGGVVDMVGDHHLELMTTSRGERRLYLLDAFLDPISAAGTVGSAEITDAKGAKRAAALLVADEARFLRIDAASSPGDRDVTVTLTAGPVPPTSMNLPIPESGVTSDSCPHHPGKH